MSIQDLDHRFTYHSPTPTKSETYTRIREAGKDLAHLIDELCPDGREKSLAITKLEEVIMWANAGIARGG